MKINIQKGFTLIELMISLVLGLLISAAAMQIFYISSLSSNIQQAGSNLVDNTVFGLDGLLRQVRKAGIGAKAASPTIADTNSPYYQNHLTPQGGVVLTAPADNTANQLKADTNLRGLLNGTAGIVDGLLSKNASTNSGSNIANNSNSNQLTIQYQVREVNQYDCMGRGVNVNDYVIERYFVRADGNAGLALACVSAIYALGMTKLDSTPPQAINIAAYIKPDGTAGTSNLAGNGEIIIPNVDYFRVLLGVTDSKNFATDPSKLNLQYIPIPTSPSITLAGKRIVNIQIGMLLRSIKPTKTAITTYKILDKTDLSLKDDIKNDGKMRNVIETAVLLRNARGTVK